MTYRKINTDDQGVAEKAISERLRGMSLRALSRELSTKDHNFSAGYLSQVIRGLRPASNALLLALGLPPRAVTVAPLPCGHAPSGKRCPVCNPRGSRPRRVYDLSDKEVRRIATDILGILLG